jgi:cytochrome P450
LGAKALDAARQCCVYLDETIAARKASGEVRDDVLGRCLVLQQAGQLGMDDLGIRNNLIGLMIGAVPTISKAAVQALDQLFNFPEALKGAQEAARSGDDALLGRYVFEAMRFNPVNPVIYRRAVRDTSVGQGTLRARTIPEGTLVMAGNLSAMFDPQIINEPSCFRTDRPWSHYILWGDAMHTCFGAQINAAVIPAVLKPLLQKQNLRRIGGIDTGGTPFPQHFMVEFA